MIAGFCDEFLHSYSEEDLAQYIRSSPPCSPASSVRLLSPKLIAKIYNISEIQDALEAISAAHQLGIRTPTVLRVATYDNAALCVMERIQAITLEDAWPNLGWFVVIKLALKLRHFVKRLRSVTSPVAGSLQTGYCRSFWLEDRYSLPPKSSPENITHFLRFWANFTGMRSAIQTANRGEMLQGKPRIPPTVKKFVFTHHDLAPRNLLVTPSNELWLIDWDFAGFYPIYFEYAAMHNFNVPEAWNIFARARWHLFTWIAAGRSEQSSRLLHQIRSKFTRFTAGRRFELLKVGGPSRYPVT